MSRPVVACGGALILSALAWAPRDPISFADVTSAAGLLAPLAGMMGHAGAWGDFDGDGELDLFVAGYCDRPASAYRPAPGPVPSRLLRGLGGGRFAPVREAEVLGRTAAALFADFDDDGALELFVANNALGAGQEGGEPAAAHRRSALFRRVGHRLVDVCESSGVCPPGLRARDVGVLDADGDRRLDVLILTDSLRPGGDGHGSLLLRNQGSLRFEIANRALGLPADLHGLRLAIADVNGDRRPDIFVTQSNRLFLSRGDLGYREATEQRELFAWNPVDPEDLSCGAAFGDLDRDGKLDLVVSAHHALGRVRLYLGTGEGRFRDVTAEAGLGKPVPTKAPHCEIQDFDNDGWPDIYLSAAGLVRGAPVPLIYRNLGARRGMVRFAVPRALERRAAMVYYADGPSVDYDGDGSLDLLLVSWFPQHPSRLLRNRGANRHWLDVEVRGRTVNRLGIGARIRLLRNGRLVGHQEVSAAAGSGRRARCHFGLGEATFADVEVVLPNGRRLLERKVAADQLVVVNEPPTNEVPTHR